MNENELAEKIIGIAIKVHSKLGPGLLESAYEKALAYELKKADLSFDQQRPIAIEYDEQIIDESFRADIVVNNKVIVELKSIKAIEDIHLKQLLTYVRLAHMKLGLLINFNVALLKHGIHRVINGKI